MPTSGARRLRSTSTASALSGRDVEDPAALRLLGGPGAVGEPVDRPEERRQRLAGPGRRDDQRVLPGARSPSHAPGWAGVGAANAPSNHARVGAEKLAGMGTQSIMHAGSDRLRCRYRPGVETDVRGTCRHRSRADPVAAIDELSAAAPPPRPGERACAGCGPRRSG